MNATQEALDELAQRVRIDQSELDVEFVTQTNDYYHAATGYAMAISLRDQAKNDLEVTEADLYLQYRRQAVERPTETQLNSHVKTHELRQEYFDKWLSAKQLADRWMALRDSFTQKGHALRELAELYKLNYFGERSTSTASADAEQRIRNRATLDDNNGNDRG
jgi:hypothetical protein